MNTLKLTAAFLTIAMVGCGSSNQGAYRGTVNDALPDSGGLTTANPSGQDLGEAVDGGTVDADQPSAPVQDDMAPTVQADMAPAPVDNNAPGSVTVGHACIATVDCFQRSPVGPVSGDPNQVSEGTSCENGLCVYRELDACGIIAQDGGAHVVPDGHMQCSMGNNGFTYDSRGYVDWTIVCSTCTN